MSKRNPYSASRSWYSPRNQRRIRVRSKGTGSVKSAARAIAPLAKPAASATHPTRTASQTGSARAVGSTTSPPARPAANATSPTRTCLPHLLEAAPAGINKYAACDTWSVIHNPTTAPKGRHKARQHLASTGRRDTQRRVGLDRDIRRP
eukprot:1195749-Prorocentrum_minimum.AAC.4